MAEARRAGSLAALGAGALVAAGAVAVKAVAVADRRRSGLGSRAARDAAGHRAEPAGMRHHEVVAVDGARLHVTDTGPLDAPPVVLLHGVTLSWQVWHLTIRALMNDHRVIAPDWRGHGASVAGRDGYGLPLLARDLGEILEALDVRAGTAVGHSMGGFGLMHHCRRPADELTRRLGALVFLSTAADSVVHGPGTAAVERLLLAVSTREPLATRVSHLPPGDLGWMIVRATFGRRPPAAAIELVRRITLAMPPLAMARSIASLLEHDASGWLGSVTLPTAVVVGTHDRLTPPAAARRIAALVPGAELTVLEDAGHLVMLERPAELEAVIRASVARARSGGRGSGSDRVRTTHTGP